MPNSLVSSDLGSTGSAHLGKPCFQPPCCLSGLAGTALPSTPGSRKVLSPPRAPVFHLHDGHLPAPSPSAWQGRRTREWLQRSRPSEAAQKPDHPERYSEQNTLERREEASQNHLPTPNGWYDTIQPLSPVADYRTELAPDRQHRGREACSISHLEDTGMFPNPSSGVHRPALQAVHMTSHRPLQIKAL